ncbi:MAG: hypothetical protein UY42_C0001G0037 [Parcubacteria group bacterium GW2011_GWA2_49_16]|nr:MAG: hypothetical protein UY42_C0001G0037 [Parcubacteria group bacterium GW2011_GWA2_49_16]
MISDAKKITHAPRFLHYYGDVVRKHLFFAGFLVLIGALIDSELRPFYLFIGVFGVLVVTILAGLTSPRNRSIMFADMIISASMFLIFEYFAIDMYMRYENFSDPVFLLRQALSVVFLLTLYFSTKTLREMKKE